MGDSIEVRPITSFVTTDILDAARERQEPSMIRELLDPVVDEYYELLMSDINDFKRPKYLQTVLEQIDQLPETPLNYVRYSFAVRLLEEVANGTGVLGGRADAVEIATTLLGFPIFNPEKNVNPHFVFPTVYSDAETGDLRDDIRTFDTSLYEGVVDRLILLVNDERLSKTLHDHAESLLQKLKESYWKTQFDQPRDGHTKYKTVESRKLFALSETEIKYFGMTESDRAVYDYREGLIELSISEAMKVASRDFANIINVPEDQQSDQQKAVYGYLVRFFSENSGEFDTETFFKVCLAALRRQGR